MRRRRCGVALLAFGVGALALAFSVSPAQAEAPSKTGWWFELQTKTLPAPLPAPPVVPAGGLYVQQGPQGPTAYGAVHYDAKDAASATLILVTAPGSTATLGAPMQACATTASWNAPASEPGAWDDAPKYGDPCTPGKVASDGSAVAFFFNTPFFTSAGLDVAIVPIDGAAPFSVAFDKPATDSLQVTTKPSALTSATPTTVSTAYASTSASSTSTATAGASGAKPSTPSATAAAPAAPAAPAASDNRTALANSVLNVAGLGDPDRGERAVALSGASAIVIGWWLLSTRAVPMPKLLGALGGGRVPESDDGPDRPDRPDRTKPHLGGVGRFARHRTTTAHRLR